MQPPLANARPARWAGRRLRRVYLSREGRAISSPGNRPILCYTYPASIDTAYADLKLAIIVRGACPMAASTPADQAPSGTSGAMADRTLRVQGIETHLLEAGDPATPPLVYLHGTFLGNLRLEAYDLLARRFHLFVPDLPGFGLTPRPEWMRDMSDYVLYLRDLLDALDLARPTLVGHSLGGWMALEMAVWYPERVARLVAANAAGLRVKGSPIA